MTDVTTFISFLTEAHGLNYSSGQYQDSKHEESIRQLLLKYGFTEFPQGSVTGYQAVRSVLPRGSFVCQPAGSNGNPDFLVRFSDGTYQDLEAKSTKGSKPMYNGVPPKKGCVYILSSAKYGSAVFHGDDVVTQADRDAWDRYVNTLRSADSIYNAAQSKAKGYARAMYDDRQTQHFNRLTRQNLFDSAVQRTRAAVVTTIPLGDRITLTAPTVPA